ncbi:hypothetical protein MtrunA17_Chr5g0400981 [Medicago truncatula]|uniref:Uncharacterized protein n=1 Tax=Medicago truncatula TaxID=3880 RepID=G7K2G0_MEDTR|nr:uncharacterized protein LOC11430990 [Medicago truncatula]AES94511.2 hypothetical protein MTR_5g015230 [Medicago truncatula]RHN53909.1 hypothetical protein MtrunA17_Chr5g0400981 [Medicago truncatula]
MSRDERKRRFNEAIVNTLYPSSPQDLEPEEDSVKLQPYSDVISGSLDDCENASTSGEEEGHDSEMEKLTRAQRKRIRKKKMKEEAILRGKLIGPLLPPTQATQCGDDAPPPTVRSNASQEGDETVCVNSKKMKQRRMAKRVAKEKRVASPLDKCNQSSISSDAVDDMREARP